MIPSPKGILAACVLFAAPFHLSVAQVADLKFRNPDTADLCDLLDIRIHAGTFEVRKPCKEIQIVVEGYVKDELVFTAASGHVVSQKGEINHQPGPCKFRVAIVDLDVIHLQGAKPGHCRIFVGYSANGGGSQYPTDIPKEKFDLSSIFNLSRPDDENGGRHLSSDKEGRTLLFSLIGAPSQMVGGPEGEPIKVVQSDLVLKCYFVPKL